MHLRDIDAYHILRIELEERGYFFNELSNIFIPMKNKSKKNIPSISESYKLATDFIKTNNEKSHVKNISDIDLSDFHKEYIKSNCNKLGYLFDLQNAAFLTEDLIVRKKFGELAKIERSIGIIIKNIQRLIEYPFNILRWKNTQFIYTDGLKEYKPKNI